MDHTVRQIVPYANNTVEDKIFSGINIAMLFYKFINMTSSYGLINNVKSRKTI